MIDKTFPIIIVFLIAGPALAFLLAVKIGFWLGFAVVGLWFLLVLFLLTLGVWL